MEANLLYSLFAVINALWYFIMYILLSLKISPHPLLNVVWEQWTVVREEWILSQWLSSILGKNIGWARDRTGDLLFSNNRFLDWSKLKALAANKIIWQKNWKLSWEGWKTMLVSAFSPIPTIFLKSFFFKVVNLLPHNAAFWYTKDRKLWKTLWEKEKLLVTSHFSFSHIVFYPIWHFIFILNAL